MMVVYAVYMVVNKLKEKSQFSPVIFITLNSFDGIM